MAADLAPLRWDLLCRVVDNHGDLGFCWRLARRLAALGQAVRLWIDDPRALAWMAPEGAGARPIELRNWAPLAAGEALGDVVVETFGGDLPPDWLASMAAARVPPVWIDLEYLSAEAYVERSHALPSPQLAGPGAGLVRWFFYPGFTPRTGGLLMNTSDASTGWQVLRLLGLGDVTSATGAPDAATVSLFGYATPLLDAALAMWRTRPTRLLACPGEPARQLAALLGAGGEPGTQANTGALTVHWLPWLAQPDYDALLHACDLNFVRGEDSFVQALACGRPFVWQLYPQDDGAQAVKLQAFLDFYLADADDRLAQALRQAFAAWNAPMGAPSVPAAFALPSAASVSAWLEHAEHRSHMLHAQRHALGDLGLRLYRFAASRR